MRIVNILTATAERKDEDMAQPNVIYKITILAMLDQIDFPLSNSQISGFFLERDYTDYFTIQQSLSGLLESELIREEKSHNSTRYFITDSGRKTLYVLREKINPEILKDLNAFFEQNKMELKYENSVISDYFKSTEDGYQVRCQIKEKDFPLIDLNLYVPDKAQAAAICANWKNVHMDVYSYLMDILMH